MRLFFPTLFFRSKKGSHTFPSPQSSHLLTLTRESGHTFPAALFLPQTLFFPPSHQHEHAQLAPQGAQEQRKALREALCCSAAAKTRFRPRGLRRLLGHNRRGHSSRSSPRRRLRTRARARARALRPRRATVRGRQRRDFARRGARTRAIVG